MCIFIFVSKWIEVFLGGGGGLKSWVQRSARQSYVYFLILFFQLEILAQALSACGRGDLAIDLRERDEEFRRRRALAFRGVYSIVNIKFFKEQAII